MDTKAIEYILELAEHKSITKTADILSISQSALSQILLRVEREVGAQLFIRQKRALIPTSAGLLYLQAAQKILNTKRRLYSDIRDLSESKKIRLGLSSKWGMSMIRDILPIFTAEFPNTLVELRQHNYQKMRDAYARYELDIAVMSYSPYDPLPEGAELLRMEKMNLIVNSKHPFSIKHANEHTLPETCIKEELRDLGFIRSAVGTTIRDLEDELFRRINYTPSIFCEATDWLAFLTLVEANLAFAFVSSDYLDMGYDICGWNIAPSIDRKNVILVRPGFETGDAELRLLELIRNYKLFKKK